MAPPAVAFLPLGEPASASVCATPAPRQCRGLTRTCPSAGPLTPSTMSTVRPLGVGLLGLGTVGTGVARVLLAKKDALERRIGRPVQICKVLVRDLDKARSISLEAPLVTDAEAVLNDPAVDIVVELIGGDEPARTFI